MRQHKVYKHNEKGYYAVKVGFAWYGFFLSVFWLLFKKLFSWLFFFILGIVFYSKFFISSDFLFSNFRAFSTNLDFLFLGFIFLISVLIGLRGNKWISERLEKKGFRLIHTIPSVSKKEAIIQTQNIKSNEAPAFAAWGRQDSYQPGHRHIKKEK